MHLLVLFSFFISSLRCQNYNITSTGLGPNQWFRLGCSFPDPLPSGSSPSVTFFANTDASTPVFYSTIKYSTLQNATTYTLNAIKDAASNTTQNSSFGGMEYMAFYANSSMITMDNLNGFQLNVNVLVDVESIAYFTVIINQNVVGLTCSTDLECASTP